MYFLNEITSNIRQVLNSSASPLLAVGFEASFSSAACLASVLLAGSFEASFSSAAGLATPF